MIYKNLFWLTTFLCLIQPYLWQSEKRILIPIIYAVYFFVIKNAILKINLPDVFWNNTFAPVKTKKPFIFGGVLLVDETDDQEKNYIDQMSVKKRAYRVLLSILVIVTPPLGILTGLIEADFFFKASNIIFFTLLLGLINSSYYGHIILIASLALLVGIFNGVELLLYKVPTFILLFMTLIMCGKQIVSNDHISLKHTVKLVLKNTLIFCTLLFIIQFALPKKYDWLKYKKVIQSSLSDNRSLPKSVNIPKSDGLNQSLKVTKKEIDDLVETINKLELSINNTNLPLDFKQNINSIGNSAKDLQSRLAQGGSNLKAQDLKDIGESLSKLKIKLKSSKSDFQKLHQDLIQNAKDFPSTYNDQLQDQINSNNIPDKLNSLPELNIEKTKSEIEKHTEKFNEAFKELQTQKLSQEIARKKQRKKEKKKEQVLKTTKILSRVLITLFFIFVVYLLFRRKKKRSKDLLDEKVINDLKREYRQLTRKRLSAREEVIQKYNFLKNALKRIHFDEAEVPPPTITHHFIASSYPRHKKGSHYLNEIFCHCYYNDQGVSKKDLKIFRSSFQGLIRYIIK